MTQCGKFVSNDAGKPINFECGPHGLRSSALRIAKKSGGSWPMVNILEVTMVENT
jgi:hypothetical protein